MATGRYGNPYYDDPNVAVIASNLAKIFIDKNPGQTASQAAAARYHGLQADELDRRLKGRAAIAERYRQRGAGGLTPEDHALIVAQSLADGVDYKEYAPANVYYTSNTGRPDTEISRAIVGAGKTLGPNDGVSMGDRDRIITDQERERARRSAISAGPGYASVAENRRNNDQRLAWEREKFQGTPHNVPPDNTVFFKPGDPRFTGQQPGFRTDSREPGSVQAREVKILDVLKRNPGMDPGEAGKIVDGRVKYMQDPQNPATIYRVDVETGKTIRVPIAAPPTAGAPPGPPGPPSPPGPVAREFDINRATSAYEPASGLMPTISRGVAGSPVGVIPQLFGGSIAPQTRASTTEGLLLNNTLVRGLMVGRAERERRDLLQDLPTFGPGSNPRDQAIKLKVIHDRLAQALEVDRQRLLQPMTPTSRREVEEGIRAREDAIREIEKFVSSGADTGAPPPSSPGAAPGQPTERWIRGPDGRPQRQ